MEGSSWCPEAVGSSDDWRKQLLPEARQRIVNKIMHTLKRHLPVSSPEGLNELKKIAERFEEKIYIAAINLSDYLRKISLKMLSLETKTQGAAAINPSLSNPTIGYQSPSESGNSITQMGTADEVAVNSTIQTKPAHTVAVNSTIQTKPAHTVAVNSTTQMGHADTVDWQEEVYQKVKSMKEIYYDQICELQQRTNLKIQQLTQTNALAPLAKLSEPLEKLKQFVQMLERTKMFLQTTKENIPHLLNDQLTLCEKQIASFVAPNWITKPEGQQFQHQPSQISTTSMQDGLAPLSINATVSGTQPNIASALQPPSLGPIQGNSFSSLQLGAIGPMQNGSFGSLQNAYQPYMFNGFGSNELQLQMQQLYMERQQQLPNIHQKQQVPVQMNGVSQGFGSGLYQPYFPGVSQQNYYQPPKPSGLFPIASQQNLETVPPQSSAQVDRHTVGIPLQPASSAIVSPRFMPIASSPTEKLSGTSKSVSISEMESRVVTADQVAALENRVAALKNRVESLEKSLSVILCAIFFALFVGSYILW